jgi:pSer/pThr/pTyr-binding forkhead associated (FHA) protein
MASTYDATAISLPESFARACRMTGPIEVRATHRPTGAETAHAVDQPFAFLGRAPQVTVRLDDPSVSQCHAYLQVVGGVPYFADLGSRTGIVWEDGSRDRGWVRPGMTIRIGQYDVRVGRPGEPPPSAEPEEADGGWDDAPFPAAVEVHASGQPPAGIFPLDRPVTLVGRHPGCDLRLLDGGVGYFHCALVSTPDEIWGVDFLSRKGFLLNGRSTRLSRLRDGDLLEAGRVSLVVRAGPGPARGLVLSGAGAAGGPPAIIPVSRPEAAAASIAPVREVMEQFQQCLLTMVRMFTAVQQEQAALMCEQRQHIRELTEELYALRANATPLPADKAVPDAALLPPPATNGPGSPLPPPPSRPKGETQLDPEWLADPHAWLQKRLAQMG